MSNDIKATLQEALGKQLDAQGYSVVDLVPIPARGDRMVRMRTLEEALDDFEQSQSGEVINYLVQVRPKGEPQSAVAMPMEDLPMTDAQNEFDRLVDETLGYGEPSLGLPKPQPTSGGAVSAQAPAGAVAARAGEGIYLPNGKLNLPYLLQNAELLFSAREFALARNIYKTVYQSGERSGLALYWMGRCSEAEGRNLEAQTHYEESITYHPTIEAYQHLSTLLVRSKKDQQAAELMERALNLKEIGSETRLELHKACGNAWTRAGQPAMAEKHYRKALEINPASDSLQSNLGALYLTMGKTSDAKRCFQEAAALNPKNDKAFAGLGSYYFAENDKRKAHDYFAKALDLNLNNPSGIYHLVKCAYEIKSYATAARIVGEYVQIAPVNANLLYSLAGLQYHLGRVEEARATVRKILDIQPQHPGGNELLKLIDQYAG